VPHGHSYPFLNRFIVLPSTPPLFFLTSRSESSPCLGLLNGFLPVGCCLSAKGEVKYPYPVLLSPLTPSVLVGCGTDPPYMVVSGLSLAGAFRQNLDRPPLYKVLLESETRLKHSDYLLRRRFSKTVNWLFSALLSGRPPSSLPYCAWRCCLPFFFLKPLPLRCPGCGGPELCPVLLAQPFPSIFLGTNVALFPSEHTFSSSFIFSSLKAHNPVCKLRPLSSREDYVPLQRPDLSWRIGSRTPYSS